ncbi:ribose 5-phosphate isomerase [SAR11 cluster bacterium PRT-SC02]|nr:ribose 5-phosphate isomerase [SAR11 cluster bacterium PRT-SC02]
MKSFNKKICISSDHAGYKIKEYIKTLLYKNKISLIDLGPHNNKSVDYPDYAKKVAKRIKGKKSDFGILVCGSGTGMAISANKIRGVRAAVCYNKTSTYLCRSHNNANILCIGARLTKKNSIGKIVSMFLKTKFEGGRHQRRIRKI